MSTNSLFRNRKENKKNDPESTRRSRSLVTVHLSYFETSSFEVRRTTLANGPTDRQIDQRTMEGTTSVAPKTKKDLMHEWAWPCDTHFNDAHFT